MVTAFSLLLILIGSIIAVRTFKQKIVSRYELYIAEKILETHNRSIAAAAAVAVISAKTKDHGSNIKD